MIARTRRSGSAEERAAAIPSSGSAGHTLRWAAAAQHRRHLSRWFFDCDRHVQVAEVYLADPRAAQQWEVVAHGSSQYVHDAVTAARGARGPAPAPG